MLEVLQFLATFCSAIFTGAALYINFVEHPARMGLDTRAAFIQWAPSYKRATLMQAPFAVIGFIAGLFAWLLGAGVSWLIAAVLIGAVVPFTFIGIMPTNHEILAPGRDVGSAETLALLKKWGRLHAVRSVLGLCATLMLWQVVSV
ncbi:MAG TPA: DUF1772 domain-containing protein [Candidatus Binatia bacterium]|nr:DUF1772 domain-containing protein [Candidatus Binatia bacterium]